MKRRMALLVMFCVAIMMLAACNQQKAPAETQPASTQAASSAQSETPQESASPQSNWPSETVTIYVPAKAGGNNDLVARVFATYLQNTLGKPFVVVNNMDGNGTVCYDTVRTADTDGHTLMYFTTALNIAHYTGVYEYDIPENFDYAAALKAATSAAMVVSANSEFESADQLAAYIKEHPGEVVCGTQLGASNHLMAAIFEQNAGGAFKHVEAGSTPDKLAALQGGHIQVSFISASSVAQYVESGELRVLGLFTSDGQRDAGTPQFPSLYELGYTDCVFAVDGMFLAPKGTDPAILEAINRAVEAALKDETVSQQLKDLKQSFSFVPYDEVSQYLDGIDEKIHQACLGAGLCSE